MREKEIGYIIKWALKKAIIIGLIIVVGKQIINFVNPKVTDVTTMINMEKTLLEANLGVSLIRDPDMVKKIYEFSDAEVTVDGDNENGIGIVYLDGNRMGLHIDDRQYSMYGLHMGDMEIRIDEYITFEYDECFEVVNDMYDGVSTAIFYCNYQKGDCLIVVTNDVTNRVVALTYFNNVNEVTEQLSPL